MRNISTYFIQKETNKQCQGVLCEQRLRELMSNKLLHSLHSNSDMIINSFKIENTTPEYFSWKNAMK